MKLKSLYISAVAVLLQMFFITELSAQISSYQGFPGSSSGLQVLVVDSLSMKPLPSVVIKAVQNKDTLYAYTDESGHASISRLAPKDSVTVSASLLGFKPLTRKIAHIGSTMVTIIMAEDPVELNAIIVKDDAVLMVSRGDTTVYNPESLKLPEGSDLGFLLTRLPGVEVRDGAVISMGRTVNKVLLNGTTMFGKDISAALRLVMSDMVKNVKIYEQHDQDRLIEADTLKKKDLVADIITKDKITTIQAIELLVAAGLFSEKELMANVQGKFDAYAVDKPTINAEVIVARNADRSGPLTSPSDVLEARLKYGDKRQFKYDFSNTLGVKYGTGSSESFRGLQYSDIDRRETSSSFMSSRDLELRDNMMAMFNIGGRTMLDVNMILLYTDLDKSVQNNDSTLYNDQLYRSFLAEREDARRFNAKIGAGTFLFRNKSRFAVSATFPFDMVHSSGSSADTLKTSSYRQLLKDDIAAWRINPGVELDYSAQILTGVQFESRLSLSHLYSQDRRTSRDCLMDILDPFNSYDYTNNSFTGKLGLSLNYRGNTNGINVNAGIAPKIVTQAVDEHAGTVADKTKSWFFYSPSFNFSFTKSPFNLTVIYLETEQIPSVNQLRSTVTFSNPLYLSAGNPDLKPSVSRGGSLSAGLTSFETGSVWTLNGSFTHISDLIGNNTVYYSAPTALPEYGYEAMAGARLSRPENIGGAWRAVADLRSSLSINKIKSKVDVNLGVSASRTPFMTDGVKNTNGQNEVYAQLEYVSYFSRAFNLDIKGRYAYGTNMLNSSKVYDYSAISADIRPSLTIASSVTLSASYVLNAMVTDMEGSGYLNDYLNASVKYAFGKDRRFAIAVNGTDLLNNSRSENISFTELYVLTTRQSRLGRCVYVSFSMKFR